MKTRRSRPQENGPQPQEGTDAAESTKAIGCKIRVKILAPLSLVLLLLLCLVVGSTYQSFQQQREQDIQQAARDVSLRLDNATLSSVETMRAVLPALLQNPHLKAA